MKTDITIKNIALAAVKRHSISLKEWKNTKIDFEEFPMSIIQEEDELPVVFLKCNEENWTLITTQRILGKVGNILREVGFAELDDVIFGNNKNSSFETTIFKTVDFYGEKNDFLMETGQPSMAYIYSIRTINNIYKTSI